MTSCDREIPVSGENDFVEPHLIDKSIENRVYPKSASFSAGNREPAK